jgi:hypothetical protein
MGRCGPHVSDPGSEPVAGCWECGSVPSGSIERGKFLDWLSDFAFQGLYSM